MRGLRVLAICFASLVVSSAQAFFIPSYFTLTEKYDASTGHYSIGYFYQPEALATGYSIQVQYLTLPVPHECSLVVGDCDKDVHLFLSATNSEFYTGNPAEIAALQQPGSGWNDRGVFFRVPLPRTDGSCAPGLTPVYRFFNNRGMHNDSNHRYAASEAARQLMAERGWTPEGIAFCAYSAADGPLRSFYFASSATPAAAGQCKGPCIAADNTAPPQTLIGNLLGAPPFLFALYDRTGVKTTYAFAIGPLPPEEAARHSFVQNVTNTRYGVHVATADRGPQRLTSLNPTLTFIENEPFWRFFPFRADYDTDVTLRIAVWAFVKSLETVGPGSHAYGLPVVEFRDVTSGLRFLFTIQCFGTVPPGDFVGREDGSGKVIVSTTFGPFPRYGRPYGAPFFYTPSPFHSAADWGDGGAFELLLTKEDFQRILIDARTVEPALSSSPGDYAVAQLQFRNQVFGDGSLGMNIDRFRIEIIRRP